ncbi:MAG: hypothetical protein CL946_05545 [Ectothiorhodospiraceae bacterium]|nr:hypothetical protein [Ectothiorhodospiraceae bacterium]
MKQFITLSLLLFAAAAQAQPQAEKSYSLLELKSMAIMNYEAIRIALFEAKQARLETDALAATRLPRLDAEASYTYLSETASIDLKIPPLVDRSITLGDGHNYSTGVIASVPLFTGFRLSSAVEMKKEAELIAKQTFEGTATEVRNKVALYYHKALTAENAVDIVEKQRAVLAKNLRTAKELQEHAQLLPYDTLQLSNRMMELEVQRENAISAKRHAIYVLMELTGSAEYFDIEESAPNELAEAALSLDSLTAIAEENRYEFQNLRSQERITGLAIRESKADYYPQVSAFAGYRYGKPGINQFANEWMGYFTGGIQLSWNLWSWGADSKETEKREIDMEKNRLRSQQLRRSIRMQLAAMKEDLRVIQTRMELTERRIVQERAKQNIVQSRFQQGLATATEVVDAETALTVAELSLEQEQIDYSVALTKLASILGKDL